MRRREEGFALLLVLWTMALLSLLAAQVTGAGRAETGLSAALRSAAQLRESADGAVNETIWHMFDGGGDYWPPGAAVRVLQEAAGPVVVTVEDERGKMDINQAPPALMQALFGVLGADKSTAATAAAAINEWHNQSPANDGDASIGVPYSSEGRLWGPPGQDFQTLDELKLVRGMTPALYQAALPYLTPRDRAGTVAEPGQSDRSRCGRSREARIERDRGSGRPARSDRAAHHGRGERAESHGIHAALPDAVRRRIERPCVEIPNSCLVLKKLSGR